MPITLVACLSLTGTLRCQPKQGPEMPQPRISFVTPCGGKAGTTFEVTVAGLDLEATHGLLFSHPGIKADLIAAGPAGKTNPPQRGQVPAVTGTARFKVVIAADTPLGMHDLRLVSALGVSNPRAFVVGDQTEVLEKEPNNDVDQAQRVEVNSTVNGAISTPLDVDYYVFSGKKGQRVVVSCLASSIDSRAQPALQLYSKSGNLLASNRYYQGNDAVLDKVLPEDGDYLVRLFAFTYTQGGPEHFYRLSITTAPWIDAVFPPVVMPGQNNMVTIYGRNLPGGQPDSSAVVDGSVLDKLTAVIKPPGDPQSMQRLDFPGLILPRSSELDGFAYHLKNAAGQSNPFLITYARAPVVLDNGDNDTPDKAQKVAIPCEIAGRIEKVHDRDWYRFDVKKGQSYTIEVLGERLGSPLDMYYTLRPADGKGASTEYDDNPDNLNPQQFYTRTEDPARQRFTAPANGGYLLQVSSREADFQAGPRHLYRVRIAPEQPDFRLIVMPPHLKQPSAEAVRAGGAAYWTVLAWRQDGFDGPIELSVHGLPPGLTCVPQYMGPGQRQSALVVSAAPDAPLWTGFVTVQGTAQVEGQLLVREARPATITWATPQQQNVPALSRIDRGLALAVREKAPFAVTPKQDVIKALPGERVSLAFHLKPQADFKGPVQLALVNFPANVLQFNGNQPLTVAAGKLEATGALDVRPGLAPGNYTLVLRATAQVPFSKDPKSKAKTNVAVTTAVEPITLTVMSKESGTGTLTLIPGEVTIEKGKSAEIQVKVKRPADLTGDLKLQVVIPNGVMGVTADDAVIPAGKNTGRVTIRAAAATNSGPRNLLVRVSGQQGGKTLTNAEIKLMVTVVRPPM
jgi:Bacterial pre-peptidase C-terminal domain